MAIVVSCDSVLRNKFTVVSLILCAILSAYVLTTEDSSITSEAVTSELKQITELKALLGCSNENLDACLQLAKQVAEKREADGLLLKELRAGLSERAAKFSKDKLHLIQNSTLHPALFPLDIRYTPKQEWKETAFPDLNIIGRPKAGTSQMYSILSSHPDAVAFHPNKEYCSKALQLWTGQRDQENVQKRLYDQARADHSRRVANKKLNATKRSVNACMNWQDVQLSMQYIQPNRGAKYLWLLRDPADWLWAVWNFWTHPIDVEQNTPGKWTVQGKNYRTPELFHELVLSSNKTHDGDRLYRQLNSNLPKIFSAFGKDNVMLVRSEDMLPGVVDQRGGLLDQLSTFTGLDRNKFNPTTTHSMKNCNDEKGAYHTRGSKTPSSAYAIAGHRKMLQETRKVIYLQHWETCMIWKEHGIEYPECLNVVNNL